MVGRKHQRLLPNPEMACGKQYNLQPMKLFRGSTNLGTFHTVARLALYTFISDAQAINLTKWQSSDPSMAEAN